MDEQSQAKLDAILRIEPAALTDEDKIFLRARSSYLTVPQREVYAEALSELTPEQIAEREATDKAAEVTQEATEAQAEVTQPEASEAPAEDTTPKVKKAGKKASVTE